MGSASDARRWKAVVARDRRADGEFFYAVETTGVVCRPSCGARAPLRRNVRFFDELSSALRAGFRPCKRCRPGGVAPDAARAATVTATCRAIEASEAPPSLTALARAAGLSPSHLQRVFKAATGVSPRQYAARVRDARVEAALARGERVTAALHGAGFSSSGRFYADSPSRRAMPPSRARRGGEGERIAYAIAPCSLGVTLVAATDRGPCAILLGDDAEAVERELGARFPSAELSAGGRAAARVIRRVIALIERPSHGLDLPLDVRGTAFQRRVWAALRALPAGETVTYAALAARVGARGAARAVARACAANPLAVAVPCHRVVRGDGGLAGYRWGVERKRALLARERQR